MCQRHEEVYRYLTGRRYSRAKPRSPLGVEFRLCTAIQSCCSIPLVGYWGVGDKAKPNDADFQALDFLVGIVGGSAYPIELTLILADEHGRLNGKDMRVAANYLRTVEALAYQRGFGCIHLSTLWKNWELKEPFGTISEREWDRNPLASILEDQSQRHYKGGLSPRQAAQRYYLMRRAEARLMPSALPELALWWTYADPKFDELQPNMPILHFWSLGKGTSAPPWFL